MDEFKIRKVFPREIRCSSYENGVGFRGLVVLDSLTSIQYWECNSYIVGVCYFPWIGSYYVPVLKHSVAEQLNG